MLNVLTYLQIITKQHITRVGETVHQGRMFAVNISSLSSVPKVVGDD